MTMQRAPHPDSKSELYYNLQTDKNDDE